MQETGILMFSTKEPVENYKTSKRYSNNSSGLYLRPAVYLLWDSENFRLIIKIGVYVDPASIEEIQYISWCSHSAHSE